jgi:hypothetical protein
VGEPDDDARTRLQAKLADQAERTNAPDPIRQCIAKMHSY